MSCVTVKVPWAPEPLACMRRSGITSRWKWASFSSSQTSCNRAGPRGPAVWMFKLSVTGVPDAWASGGRLDWSFIELLLRLDIGRFGRSDRSTAGAPAWRLVLSAPLGAFVENGPDEVETGSRCEQRGDSGGIVGWRNLDKISADDLEPPGHLA